MIPLAHIFSLLPHPPGLSKVDGEKKTSDSYLAQFFAHSKLLIFVYSYHKF